jgi:hypothetical protein
MNKYLVVFELEISSPHFFKKIWAYKTAIVTADTEIDARNKVSMYYPRSNVKAEYSKIYALNSAVVIE